MVGPLIWLLVFDLVVCAVYWIVFTLFGLTAPAQLVKVMVALVILINVVIVVVWLLGILGVAPSGLMSGPRYR